MNLRYFTKTKYIFLARFLLKPNHNTPPMHPTRPSIRRTLPFLITAIFTSFLIHVVLFSVPISACDSRCWPREDANNFNSRARTNHLLRSEPPIPTQMILFRNNSSTSPVSTKQNIHEMTVLSLGWESPYAADLTTRSIRQRGPLYFQYGSRLYHVMTEDKAKVIHCYDGMTGQRVFVTSIPHPGSLQIPDIEVRLSILQIPRATLSALRDEVPVRRDNGKWTAVLSVSTNFGQFMLVDAFNGRLLKAFAEETPDLQSLSNTNKNTQPPVQAVATAVQGVDHNGRGSPLSSAIYHTQRNVIQALSAESLAVLSRYVHPVISYTYQESLALAHTVDNTPLLFAVLRNESSQEYPDLLAAHEVNQNTMVMKQRWSYIGNSTLGTPAISHMGNSLLIVENQSIVRSLSTVNGELQWSATFDSPSILPQLTIGANLVFATSTQGECLALDIETGSLKWKRHIFLEIEDGQISFTPGIVLHSDVILYTAVHDGQSSPLPQYHVIAIEPNGGTLWQYNASAPHDGKNMNIDSISLPTMDFDGSLLAGLLFAKPSSNERSAAVTKISEMEITGVVPDYFYLDTGIRDMLVLGPFTDIVSSKPSSVWCVLHLLSGLKEQDGPNAVWMHATSVETDRISCQFSGVLSRPFHTSQSVLGVQIVTKHRHSNQQEFTYRSNVFGGIRFTSPAKTRRHDPLGMPIDSTPPTLTIHGNNFILSKPKSARPLVPMCRFTYDTHGDKPISSLSMAVVINDETMSCIPPPEVMDTDNMVRLEVSIDYDEQFGIGRFIQTPLPFIIYQPPETLQFRPKLGPTGGKTELQYIIQANGRTPLSPFLDQQGITLKMSCGFQTWTTGDNHKANETLFESTDALCTEITASDNNTFAASAGRERAECVCRSASVSEPQISQFSFSINGLVHNITEHEFRYYRDPVLIDIHPKQGNISGGTEVTITGNGFIQSALARCRFGASWSSGIDVPAKWVSDHVMTCITPKSSSVLPPIDGTDHLTVVVTVSLNGQDFVQSSNLSFTFDNYLPCTVPSCNDRGVCNHSTGLCTCIPGYRGESCDQLDRMGFWSLIAVFFVLVGVSFLLCVFCMFVWHQYRSQKYTRLIEESSRKDISSSL